MKTIKNPPDCPNCKIPMKVVQKTENFTLFSCSNCDWEEKVLLEQVRRAIEAQTMLDLLDLAYDI